MWNFTDIILQGESTILPLSLKTQPIFISLFLHLHRIHFNIITFFPILNENQNLQKNKILKPTQSTL